MKTTKREIGTAVAELNARVPRAVHCQQSIEMLQAGLAAEKTAIRQLLSEAKIDRHTCAEGCEALLVSETRWSWNITSLIKLWRRDVGALENFTPRKPDGKRLAAELAANAGTPAGNKLRGCGKTTTATRLELRAPEAMGRQDACATTPDGGSIAA
jgi:hypothetical protein